MPPCRLARTTTDGPCVCAHLALCAVATPAFTPQPLLRQAEDRQLVLGIVGQVLQTDTAHHQPHVSRSYPCIVGANLTLCRMSMCRSLQHVSCQAQVTPAPLLQWVKQPGSRRPPSQDHQCVQVWVGGWAHLVQVGKAVGIFAQVLVDHSQLVTS